MADSNRIFRQAALDRLSSPEQLDQLMQVTTPKSWLALGACCVLVLIALVWSIWGTIRINVSGRGILIKQGGVFVATAFGDGRVARILVHEGESVTNQQVLALLSVPELEMRMFHAGVAQSNLESELVKLKEYQRNERDEENRYQEAEIKTYQAISNDYTVQIAALEDRYRGLMELSSGTTGVIDRPTLLNVQNDLFSAKHGFDQTGIQVKQVHLNQLQAEEGRHQRMLDKEASVDQGRSSLETLSNLYRLTSEIRSPFSGTVLELTVKSNQLVTATTPIMSLQSSEARLEAWLFLPPAEGKQVSSNMPVHLAPASVRKEDYGMMKGKVDAVSSLPATPHLMSRVLENPTLVAEFSQQGAPIYVVVELFTATNASGFEWTSRKGPPMPITSGTLCEGTITVNNRSPISFVLPLLKSGTGL